MSDTPSAAKPAPRGRFSLWQLFVFTTLVCLAGACLAWAREHPEALLFFVAIVFGTLVFTFHALTGWPTFSIAASVGVVLFLGCLLLPAQRGTREAARRMQCSNHLKQIGLALENYHDVFGCFPPAYIADASGKPMHSWRVLILPFMEQKALYNKYRFDEPWDGPNNRTLHKEVVIPYSCPSHGRVTDPETTYLAVVGRGTIWPGANAYMRYSDIADGSSDTLIVVESIDSGIHWMEPRDLDFATMPLTINGPTGPGMSSDHPNVVIALFADGRTQALVKDTPPSIIRALLTIGGGESVGDY
jgi:hypothetical protein